MQTESAAQTLDNIRQGGQHLLMIANVRIEEGRKALAAGDFSGALSRLNEAIAKIGPLASAQVHIGNQGSDVVIMRISELEVGMKIQGVGEVTHHEQNHDCADPNCTLLGIDGGSPDEIDGTAEVYVTLEQA